jgi:hypothetical protein
MVLVCRLLGGESTRRQPFESANQSSCSSEFCLPLDIVRLRRHLDASGHGGPNRSPATAEVGNGPGFSDGAACLQSIAHASSVLAPLKGLQYASDQ